MPQQEPTSRHLSARAVLGKMRPAFAFGGVLAGLAWRFPFRAAGVILLVLLPVAPMVVVHMVRLRHQAPREGISTGQAALEALDAGDQALAGELAEEALAGRPSDADSAAATFVLGILADERAASLMLASEQRRFRLLAATHLQRSRGLGFPPGRKPDGAYMLGKNLLQSGQAEKSLPVLEEALRLNSGRQTEINRLLAGACQAASKPRLAEALAYNARWLADADLPVETRHDGLLERARIQMGMHDFEACRQTLAEIPARSAMAYEAILLAGRVLLEEARAMPRLPGGRAAPPADVVARYRLAIDQFRKAQGHNRAGLETTADSMYLIGICYLEMADRRAALGQLQRTHQRFFETPAGFAAGFEAAELLRLMGRTRQALAAYRSVLDPMDARGDPGSPWLRQRQLRLRAAGAYHDLLKARDYERATELAQLLDRVFPRQRATLLKAQAYSQWGRSLVERVASEGGADAKLAALGRQRLRTAGRIYLDLADMRRMTRAYPQDVFQAAENLLAGHDYTGAIKAFEEYLETETRRMRPRALLGLAEARLAQGRPAEALIAVRELVDYHPKAGSVFQARLVGSQAHWELGDLNAAETLLLDNLHGDALTPASQEWRQSLFVLGRLLYHGARYKEAIRHLEEAVARYPQAPEAIEARYLAAEAYRKSANTVEQEARGEATAEGRLARRREAERLLEAGLVRYEQERDALLAGLEQGNLSPLHQATLRNCFFARGAVLFELGRYHDAIQAYASVTNRYQQAPEVLEAYVQIAACYRRLGQPIEAKSTLEQAKYALKHIPDGPSFTKTTNYSREEWTRLLDSLGTL